jgi:hypothetical protein
VLDAAIARQRSNKRGPDGKPDKKKPKGQPPNQRRGVDLEKLELHEGRVVARNLETNATRPLTDQELQHQVAIVPCKDKQCSDELKRSDTGLLIPAVAPPSLPAVNHDTVPTFTLTLSMRTEVRSQRRSNVHTDMPAVTDLAVSETWERCECG